MYDISIIAASFPMFYVNAAAILWQEDSSEIFTFKFPHSVHSLFGDDIIGNNRALKNSHYLRICSTNIGLAMYFTRNNRIQSEKYSQIRLLISMKPPCWNKNKWWNSIFMASFILFYFILAFQLLSYIILILFFGEGCAAYFFFFFLFIYCNLFIYFVNFIISFFFHNGFERYTWHKLLQKFQDGCLTL